MRKRLAALVAVVLMAALGTQLVAADGTEQLGTPSIAIADGTDVIAAGTGMLSQPGVIDVTVPAGASVEQVLLYWEGHYDLNRDDTISINGIPVTGTSIGGPTKFFSAAISETFRADITGLGLVGPGANALTIADMDFDTANNGAGIIVIVDDGTANSIELRDGNDLAFYAFSPPKDTTVPQTYTFDAASVDRTATLDMFFSSVAGSASTGDFRPSLIEVESGGVLTSFPNLLDSINGEEWDTIESTVNVPAGATSLTVQAISWDDETRDRPASFAWNAAALTLPQEVQVEGAIDIEKFTRVDNEFIEGNCETVGKPRILTLVYTGDGDDASDHNQNADKALVMGDPNDASPVRIVATDKKELTHKKAKIFFDGIVEVGDSFVLDPANVVTDKKNVKLGSNTTIFVYDLSDNLLQKVMFHTSCSQPLEPGDQFGSILIESWVGKEGTASMPTLSTGIGEDADTPTGPIAQVGDSITWTYIVSNPGDTQIANVMVVDDNGTPGDTSDDFSPAPVLDGLFNDGDTDMDGRLDPGEEWLYTASSVAVAGQYGNLGTVVGTPVDDSGTTIGDDVWDEDPSHYFASGPTPDVCESKPSLLTMVYTGDGPDATSHSQDDGAVQVIGDPEDAASVRIIALDRDNMDHHKTKVFFDGTVALGDSFDIDASVGDPKKGKLGSKTFLLILDADDNLLQFVEFHTSCSQPLSIGDQFGAVQLSAFVAS